MFKYFIRYIISTLFLLFFISCTFLEKNKTSPIKISAPSGPGDCVSCHRDKEVLPDDHIDTKDMTGNDCNSCHETEETGLRTKIPLGHTHNLEGISCKGCHDDPASPEAAGSKVCQKCHDDERALIDAAKELEINPHFSPHEGKVPDCNKCHHQHKSSENYCANCHGLEYEVP